MREAVSVAVWLDVMFPLVPVRLAELEPLATVMLAGTVRSELELERPTETPPLGAVWVRVTVHEVLDDGPRLVGEQETDERAGVEPPPLPD